MRGIAGIKKFENSGERVPGTVTTGRLSTVHASLHGRIPRERPADRSAPVPAPCKPLSLKSCRAHVRVALHREKNILRFQVAMYDVLVEAAGRPYLQREAAQTIGIRCQRRG